MTSLIEIKVPDIGGIADVEIIELLINAGDTIVLEQPLAVMESDKASMDLPAPTAGIVQTVHVKVGDKVSEGSLIATVALAESGQVETSAPVAVESGAEQPKVVAPEPVAATPAPVVPAAPAPVEPAISQQNGTIAHASPAIRRYARELGVEISTVKAGTGRKGRILKEDV
jgi:pyruvate dehydrogenase E2 component (dihydrolipoamide acetyltransferase)